MDIKPASQARRFACNACGQCCNRGPEIELGEAASLADTFITSILFKAHSVPLNARSESAAQWWRKRESRIPLRPALDEARQHHTVFAGHRLNDRRRERQVYLDISAIVDDDGQGRCPALAGTQCSIYDKRPLTCRTVPLHYSRSPSTLLAYFDRFAGTPGYRCDTGPDAPPVLDGNRILDSVVSQSRYMALARAKEDRPWKRAIVATMESEDVAAAIGLPNLYAVLHHADNGFATQLPMIVAWRIAVEAGIMARHDFLDACGHQARLVRHKLANFPTERLRGELLDLLAVYQSELSTPGAE